MLSKSGTIVPTLVGYSVELAVVVVLYFFMHASNKKDREQAERGELSEEEEEEKEEEEVIDRGMLDMTELDNRGIRYILKPL
jgi:hypothetical protein